MTIISKPARGRPPMLAQSEKLTIYLPVALRERIETVRGDAPLAAWIRTAIEQRLQQYETSGRASE